MRKPLNVLLLLLFSIQLPAQSIFYGLTPGVGSGVISKFDATANSLTASYTFVNPGTDPQSSEFVEGTDGKLYSTTRQGGSFNKGAILSFDPATNIYTSLHNLSSHCTGVLINGAGSLIYGLTDDYIFSFNTSTATYALLYGFTEEEKYPLDGLTPGADGKYYGITADFIFSFDPLTNVYTRLADIGASRGRPTHGLTLGPENLLYGTASYSDDHYLGILFSFDPATNTYQDRHFFNSSTGEFPLERMTLSDDGKLYGVTSSGPHLGVIYSFDPATDTYLHLYDFENGNGGRYTKTLTVGVDSKLYGASYSVDFDDGIIFSYDPYSNIFTIVHELPPVSEPGLRGVPAGKLLQTADGMFYGLNANDYGFKGQIFSYDKITDVLSNIDLIVPNGLHPDNSLVQGPGDLFYGITSSGGNYDKGILFSFNPANNAFTKILDFDAANGNPTGKLLLAANGKFYGTTQGGGFDGMGVLFSFNPADNSYSRLYDFTINDGNGASGLVQGNNGLLYGTSYIQSAGELSIFTFNTETNNFNSVFGFGGLLPKGNLVKAPNGNLYGMALGGDFSYGAIFIYDLVSNAGFVSNFDYDNGAWPYGDLILAANSRFYGMTSEGGLNGAGVIFSFNPNDNSITKVFDFNGTNGAKPLGGFTLNTDGKLLGMTSEGGLNNFGVLFSFDPTTNNFNKLQDFDGLNGGNAQFGALAKPRSAPPKFVNVNLFGGSNPYNNIEWNNWNTFSNLSSGIFNYSDGTPSGISAVLSQQSSVSDNGAGYNPTMAPPQVVRYASYSTSNRTLTISGLDNSKTYDLEIYASRSGVSNNTTRFIISPLTIDIATANNLTNKAVFNDLSPVSGRIIVNVNRLNTYNYINGFIITEKGNGAPNPAPVVNAGTDENITLPITSAQLNGSATDINGSIFSYSWSKISGPDTYNFTNASDPATTVTDLEEGTYTFRLTAFDNEGASSFDDVNVVVTPTAAPTRFVKVNIYGGNNPYNHAEWNNWNSISSLNSGNLRFNDGTVSTINAVLSQQSGMSDNGTPYNATMAPVEVVRYASYSTSASRTLTISGLDNSKTYDLEIYASRKGGSNNTSRFTIGSTVINILTDNNLANKASFVSITPAGGQIIVNITRVNAYNYINGFILTEHSPVAPVAPAIGSVRKSPESEVITSSAAIYPNPVKDRFVLEVNNNYTGKLKVQVVNMNGVIQKEFNISKQNPGNMRAGLSIGDLKQGVYLIRVHSGKLTETKKVVKI